MCRAKTKAEFTAKLGVVEKAAETVFWLEMVVEAEILPLRKVADLFTEANELLGLLAASKRTARLTRR